MTSQRYWPVYKGESFDIWNPDTGKYYAWADSEKLQAHLYDKRLRQAEKSRSAFFGTDPEWLNERSSLPCLFPRIAFRRATGPTNRRTMVACLLPPQVFLADQAAYLFFHPRNCREEAYILGIICSVTFDWYARRVVEINLGFHIFNNSPVPRPPEDDPLRNRVIHIAGRLAAVDDRYGEWAEQVGVEVASVKTEREKADLIAELDAAVALLYGLDESDIQVIYDTFHKTIGHLPDINAVLSHYRNLQ